MIPSLNIIEEQLTQLSSDYFELLQFTMTVANGTRSDGTYNYCREALEIKAKDVLSKINQ